MEFHKERLKHKRKQYGLTLEALAKRCFSSKSYIWELENNKEIEPSGKKVFLISQALDVPMDYFYGVDDNTKKVLGTLISWIAQSSAGVLSAEEAKQLLEDL